MVDANVGKRIRILRESKGMTQKEAADALDMPRTTYVHYEDGSNEPRISVLIKIALYYSVQVDWLIGLEAREIQNSPPPIEDEREAYRKMLSALSDEELIELKKFTSYLVWKRSHPEQDASKS